MPPPGSPAPEPPLDQLGQLRVLYALTETLMASRGAAEVYEAAMDAFGNALGVERVSILISGADGVPRFKAWRRLSERYRNTVEGHTFWPPDDPAPSPVAVDDVASDPAMAALREVALAEGIAALLAVPLVVAGRVLGKCMLYFEQPKRLSADGVRLAQTVADHVALAVEREVSRAQLRQSEERFRSLLQNATDVTTILDANGTIRYESPACYRLLGWSEAELIGRNAFELVHQDDRDATLAVFAEAIRQGETPHPVEFRFRRADGGYVTFEAVGVNRLDDPAIAGVVVNSRDVTERNRLAAELRQAQKMEAIGRLAGGIAHDFNNLLTVIGGYTEAALAETDPDETKRCLEEVRRATDRASTLTAQLLAFARRRVISPAAIDLNAAIASLSDMLQRLIGADIRLVTEPGAGVGFIKVDLGQFEQVVMNLAINARDAMPDGGTLTLATSVDAATGCAVLTVNDTGRGMDRETLSRVFEPFFTTKGPGEGTGLGLATVYGIVSQHGGSIGADSAPGRGTTFRVSFPRNSGPAPEGVAATHAAPATNGTETILLVEDEPMVRRLVQAMLAARGYTVLEASSGEDALERFGSAMASVDLLVTDVVMPGINGRVLAERLSTLKPGLKVLYISGYTDDAVLGAQAARVSFLRKPFAPDTLRATVRDVLDAGRAGLSR
ncbi:MAG: PAS domain S-box protein [Vicinamibacterales bacterium]